MDLLDSSTVGEFFGSSAGRRRRRDGMRRFGLALMVRIWRRRQARVTWQAKVRGDGGMKNDWGARIDACALLLRKTQSAVSIDEGELHRGLRCTNARCNHTYDVQLSQSNA